MVYRSDKYSSPGVLEFNTAKAGQEMAPMNLPLNDPNNQSRSAINSITGKYNGVVFD